MTSPPSPTEIELRVREALAQSSGLRIDLSALPRNVDLFDIGMSSHASVNVMLTIEDLLEFEFPEERVVKSTFTTIDSICGAIEQVL